MDSALILAGGSSTRLRPHKALVEVGGKAMVRRVFDAIAPLADEVVVSVADANMEAAIRRVLSSPRFIVDRRPGMGPIEAFQRGFEAAHGERILVAPCDAPLLRTELYQLLLQSLGEHEAAVPRPEAFDPVRAVYRAQAVIRVLEARDDVPKSPSALVDRLDTAFVEVDDLRSIDPRLDSFLDVNTREDLRRARRRFGKAGPG